jgi:hypothetical protein
MMSQESCFVRNNETKKNIINNNKKSKNTKTIKFKNYHGNEISLQYLQILMFSKF